ncbi:MAG: hypothetical protein WC856_23615 [Methylococcaceae bacterium]
MAHPTRGADIHAATHAPYRLLEEVLVLSSGDSSSGNMLIQGDNLDALKALLPCTLPETPDTKEKRNIGELWATKSEGKSLFLMAVLKNAKGQGLSEQIAFAIA